MYINYLKKKNLYNIMIFTFPIITLFLNLNNYILNIIIFSLAIIPLAIRLGNITSDLSSTIGEKKGGLIAATIGNMPEIMMGVWSIKVGLISMAKAALIGSIINNMLLVLGISVILGGVKYKEQKFNKNIAKTNFNMLLLAMASFTIIFSISNYTSLSETTLNSIGFKISIILIGIYLLGLIFSLYTHKNLFILGDVDEEIEEIRWQDSYKNLAYIIIISVLLYFISEKLITNISLFTEEKKFSPEFIGIMLLPILGNIGENVSAIMCAIKNKVNASLEIAIGSSIQIALFATPVLITFGYFLGINMNMIFSSIQMVMLFIAVIMSYIVFVDGKTYWFEGCILVAIYVIVTICYFYVA